MAVAFFVQGTSLGELLSIALWGCRAEKAEVALQDPAKSLLGAVKNILEKGEHPKPEALYIRKSSAEENLVKGQEK